MGADQGDDDDDDGDDDDDDDRFYRCLATSIDFIAVARCLATSIDVDTCRRLDSNARRPGRRRRRRR